MKPDKPTQRDAKHGEGDHVSAQHDYRQLREFVARGEAARARREAAAYVAHEREGGVRAARKAARGCPTEISLEEMVARNRSLIERVRPLVDRAVGRLRARCSQK